MWRWLLGDHFFRMIKESKERESVFVENGSKLLEKMIASCNGRSIPIHSFSVEELKWASNNFQNHLQLSWYKGSLEGRVVFIRSFLSGHVESWTKLGYVEYSRAKSGFNESTRTKLGINDLVIAAQMSAHNNVLKPIGCCLEMRPLATMFICCECLLIKFMSLVTLNDNISPRCGRAS